MTSTVSLADAVGKLARAVDAAEAALAARGRVAPDPQPGPEPTPAGAESPAGSGGDATAERAALEAALADLQRDHAQLKSAAEDAGRRLDGAIEQVEAILSGRI